ncbi:MAG: IclR family transcriptional regulator [Burkholderiales bacterium]|nr:IclR family transcriptional regulator [Anaerolineae bacterium]
MAISPNGIGVREVARSLSYNPAVVQKSMQALVAQGFAQQDPITQHYHLGPAALQVGLAGLAKLELFRVAHPFMQALADNSGETALLGIRHGDIVMYIDKALSNAEIRLDVPVGATRPLNCTAIGKILLAELPDEEIDRLSQAGAFTQASLHSVTDAERIKREMIEVRERGMAADREEFTLGAMCLAAPIRNHEGRVVAAIAIAGPTQRVDSAKDQLATQVLACADNITTALGGMPQFPS